MPVSDILIGIFTYISTGCAASRIDSTFDRPDELDLRLHVLDELLDVVRFGRTRSSSFCSSSSAFTSLRKARYSCLRFS